MIGGSDKATPSHFILPNPLSVLIIEISNVRMYYIIYLSVASKWPNEAELREILDISRVNNHRKNISGVLLYGDGKFIQVLEGREADVQETYHRIAADQRHKGLTPIARGELDERSFPEWSMGYRAIEPGILQEIEGYFDTWGSDFLEKHSLELPIKLLRSFVRTNRLSI